MEAFHEGEFKEAHIDYFGRVKRQQNAWAFYDWANSVYSLVISTAVFPLYYDQIVKEPLHFGAYSFEPTAAYSYVLMLSFLTVAFLSPLLSGMADRNGSALRWLGFWMSAGSLACAALFFFTEANPLYGLGMSYLASVSFWSSLVFYNSFLPAVASREDQDKLSAKGYSLGYIGSSILLMFCLALILNAGDRWGMAFRISFVLTGLWWLGFGWLSIRRFPKPLALEIEGEDLKRGYRVLIRTVRTVFGRSVQRRFLVGFSAFSVGVQTIILIASLYGSSELKISSEILIGTILAIQFFGVAGAALFRRLSTLLGNIPALTAALGVWTLVCGAAFILRPEDPDVAYKFFGLGALVGLVMGGTQSLSRSTFSKLLEAGEGPASYFSLMDVIEKLSIVVGTLLTGFLSQYTGGMRWGALALALFFIAGIAVLLPLNKPYRALTSAPPLDRA